MATTVTSFTPNVMSVPPERTPLSFARASAQPVMQPTPVVATPVVAASPVRSPIIAAPSPGTGPVLISPVRTPSPVRTATVSPVRTTTVSPVRTTTVSPVRAATVSPVRAATVSPVRTTTVSPVRAATVSPVRTTTVSPTRSSLNVSPLRSTLQRLSPHKKTLVVSETPSGFILTPELARLNLSQSTLGEPVFVANGSIPLESTTRLQSMLEDQNMSPIHQYTSRDGQFSLVKAVSPDGKPVYVEVERDTISVPLDQVLHSELRTAPAPSEYLSLIESSPQLKSVPMVLECDNGICVVRPNGENLQSDWLLTTDQSVHKHVRQILPLVHMKDLLGKECIKIHKHCVNVHKLIYRHMCRMADKLHKERRHALECLKAECEKLESLQCSLLHRLEEEQEKLCCMKRQLHCTDQCICGKGALLKNISKNIIERKSMKADLSAIISLARNDAKHINALVSDIHNRVELLKACFCEKRLVNMRQ